MSGIVLRTRRFFTSALLGASLLGTSGLALGQTDEQRAGARTLATEGAAAFNEGRWKDAVDLFSRAESLVHAPPHLLFMARAHAKLGQFVKAREAYLKIVKEQLSPNAPQAFRDAQVTAEEERKQVEPHIGRLLVKVEGAEGAKDLAVTVDGHPFPTVMLGVPQPMDPGEHTVAAAATGFKGPPSRVTLKDAGSASVVVKLEVDPTAASPAAAAPSESSPVVSTAPSGAPPSDTGPVKGTNGLRIGSYVGFGVGAVGLALGTVFILQSSSKRKDADALAKELGCSGDSCSGTSQERKKLDALDSDAQSAQTLGIVGYAVGGVGVAAGVVLFVLSNKKDDAPRSAFITPYVGPGAAGVHGSFAF